MQTMTEDISEKAMEAAYFRHFERVDANLIRKCHQVYSGDIERMRAEYRKLLDNPGTASNEVREHIERLEYIARTGAILLEEELSIAGRPIHSLFDLVQEFEHRRKNGLPERPGSKPSEHSNL